MGRGDRHLDNRRDLRADLGGTGSLDFNSATTAKSRTRLYGVLAAIGFLTPVPGAVHWAAAGDVADPIFPVCTMFILGLLVGVPAGLFGIWRFRGWSDETI